MCKKQLEEFSVDKIETLNLKIKDLEVALATKHAEITELNSSCKELESKNFKTAEKLEKSNEEVKRLQNDAKIQKRAKAPLLENEGQKREKLYSPVKTPVEIMLEGDAEIQVDMEDIGEMNSSPKIVSVNNSKQVKKAKGIKFLIKDKAKSNKKRSDKPTNKKKKTVSVIETPLDKCNSSKEEDADDDGTCKNASMQDSPKSHDVKPKRKMKTRDSQSTAESVDDDSHSKESKESKKRKITLKKREKENLNVGLSQVSY